MVLNISGSLLECDNLLLALVWQHATILKLEATPESSYDALKLRVRDGYLPEKAFLLHVRLNLDQLAFERLGNQQASCSRGV